MELLSRPKHDRYTRPGEYNELERRLRSHPECADIPVLVCYAFDMRTRVGPFLFADMRLLTAGPRAIASALYNAGFTTIRIVQRQWNPRFRVSQARFDGRPPQMLFVSSMQIHSACAYEMIADAYQLGDDRPLILAGGAKAIYEPWDFFGCGPGGRYSADVAVTGEEFVALELLDRIMAHKGRGEHPRRTFHRLRRSGLLDDIPGLVFREGDEKDPLGRLINTGVQRLVRDLDELPHPMIGLALLEPPHKRPTLSRRPVPLHKLTRYGASVSLVTTHGCKFHCPYCPIPAYNQFTFRYKSPQRLRDEIEQIYEKTGIDFFFGTDDNFFNNRETVEETFTELAKGKVRGRPFRDAVFFGTEATEYDVFKNQDLLGLCRAGGLRAIWFGIEDMTAELVKKGQSPEKTRTLFALLNRHGICPMPMMMHHDGQPLITRGNLYGLLNQVNFLRRSGSVSVQVTILTPSVGSKSYEEPFRQGMVIEQAGNRKLEEYQYDGNHCIATNDPHPWRKQLNIYLAYASFYNPLNFVRAVANWKDPLWKYRVLYQAFGMAGLVKSVVNSWSWLWNLYKGPIKKMEGLPRRRLLMVPPPVSPGRPAPVMQFQSV
ncbi:MAG TPA: radical SAM protein [Gemmataceae bacterium]|nr:radical SAM protein [Gemmataceae bacterium]